MSEVDISEFAARFKIVCRRCGGEGTLDITESEDYGGETGISPGTISVGCPSCGADWFESI